MSRKMNDYSIREIFDQEVNMQAKDGMLPRKTVEKLVVQFYQFWHVSKDKDFVS